MKDLGHEHDDLPPGVEAYCFDCQVGTPGFDPAKIAAIAASEPWRLVTGINVRCSSCLNIWCVELGEDHYRHDCGHVFTVVPFGLRCPCCGSATGWPPRPRTAYDDPRIPEDWRL